MARVTITQEDHDKSKVVPPGKYVMTVTNYEQKQAGTDGSDLYLYTLKVRDGKEKGAIAYFQVSEKAVGAGIPFWNALGLETGVGKSLDPSAVKIGSVLGVQIQRSEYNGRQQNKPVDFYKLEGSEAGPAVAKAQ